MGLVKQWKNMIDRRGCIVLNNSFHKVVYTFLVSLKLTMILDTIENLNEIWKNDPKDIHFKYLINNHNNSKNLLRVETRNWKYNS